MCTAMNMFASLYIPDDVLSSLFRAIKSNCKLSNFFWVSFLSWICANVSIKIFINESRGSKRLARVMPHGDAIWPCIQHRNRAKI